MTDEEKKENLKKYGSIYPNSIILNDNQWFMDDLKVDRGIQDEMHSIVFGVVLFLTMIVLAVALTFGVGMLLF
jgi:hypothetical protein